MWRLIFAVAVALHALNGTAAAEKIKIERSCAFTGAGAVGDKVVFKPSAFAKEVFGEVLRAARVNPSKTTLYEAPGLKSLGEATVINGRLYVLYDAKLLGEFGAGGNRRWAAYALFAHEVSHLMNNDTVLGANKEQELFADRVAGGILRKLGAKRIDVETAYSSLPDTSSDTHGERDERVGAAISGWDAESTKTRYIQIDKAVAHAIKPNGDSIARDVTVEVRNICGSERTSCVLNLAAADLQVDGIQPSNLSIKYRCVLNDIVGRQRTRVISSFSATTLSCD